jgi:hypothetical protein
MADPTLVNANITFHTNDEDKDDDTVVSVSVRNGPTIAAQITDRFQHFNDHSDAGPFDLEIVTPLTRDDLKTGFIVHLEIKPNGNDTWRFNFFLDLRFSDGSHLFGRASRLQLTQDFPRCSFGIE